MTGESMLVEAIVGAIVAVASADGVTEAISASSAGTILLGIDGSERHRVTFAYGDGHSLTTTRPDDEPTAWLLNGADVFDAWWRDNTAPSALLAGARFGGAWPTLSLLDGLLHLAKARARQVG